MLNQSNYNKLLNNIRYIRSQNQWLKYYDYYDYYLFFYDISDINDIFKNLIYYNINSSIYPLGHHNLYKAINSNIKFLYNKIFDNKIYTIYDLFNYKQYNQLLDSIENYDLNNIIYK